MAVSGVPRYIVVSFQVNSAGNLVGGPLESVSMDQYDKQMELNCRSVVCLSQLAVPHLVKTKGNIVNVSSVTGTRSVRSPADGGALISKIPLLTRFR